MALVDYFAIEEAIKAVLEADSTLTGVNILIEEELSYDRGDTILIYLDRRDAPDEDQVIAAGTRLRMLLRFSVWVYSFHLNMREAIHKRDDLLGKVEIALMKNRQLNNTVAGSWITGGEFQTAKQPGGVTFFSGAEIELVAQKTAVST